ncbi:MAG: multiprotein bridging factor aMBF1 [Methanoregula sp.]|uniref:multiprotein bridging factor aMBF1 n=1 Tax=Methanoregula sp. TaxID=2052170 RepID=UPI0025D017C8|nr:multiprotein bridging factor aMBF1 [Methanoregula sp.]MCK9632513.1 multiprotein bridging factor aMBF1 [Methanoregula sp.]
MQCEMCGETIRGAPKLVRVEGAEMQVCSKCERFGTAVQQVRRTDLVRPSVPRQGSPRAPSAAPSQYRKRDMFDFIEGDVVDDYHERIRHARMEKGLSQKDLAMQMKEKEHLIQKIENHDLIPEENVRKKLEKVLGIRLIDAPETEVEKKVPGSLAPTLGDLTIIRKAKK